MTNYSTWITEVGVRQDKACPDSKYSMTVKTRYLKDRIRRTRPPLGLHRLDGQYGHLLYSYKMSV